MKTIVVHNAPPGTARRVGVVGGSIAGCTVAIELSRAGWDVSVFERSRGALVGRGAGLATRTPTLTSLIARNLVDADFPHSRVTTGPLICCGTAEDRYGQSVWIEPRDQSAMRWADLYRSLRHRVPAALYHQGHTVIDAQMSESDTVALRFEDGSSQVFDLVIFADGYQSLGRRLLFPDVEVQYRGYVAWRGLLDERHLTNSEPLESAITRVIYRDQPGHLIIYFVPGPTASVARRERTVNWVAFMAVPPDDLPQFLTDRSGQHHTYSLPPGTMRAEEERRLRKMAEVQLPPYFAEIVTGTQDTFAQPIYIVEPPAFHCARICVLGDAGAVTTPITGSGVFRGTTNAIELADAVNHESDLDRALATWDEAQVAMGRAFTTWGRQMEEAMVWATPDLSVLDAREVEDWSNSAAPFPQPRSYSMPPRA